MHLVHHLLEASWNIKDKYWSLQGAFCRAVMGRGDSIDAVSCGLNHSCLGCDIVSRASHVFQVFKERCRKEVEELRRRQEELVKAAIRENEKIELSVLRKNEERLEELRREHQESEKRMMRENEEHVEKLRKSNEESLALMLTENETRLTKVTARHEEEERKLMAKLKEEKEMMAKQKEEEKEGLARKRSESLGAAAKSPPRAPECPVCVKKLSLRWKIIHFHFLNIIVAGLSRRDVASHKDLPLRQWAPNLRGLQVNENTKIAELQ